mgnify:FL=1
MPFSLPGKDYVVVSPDGTITLTVRVDGSVTLAVDCDGREVISGLSPAMRLEGVSIPGSRPAVVRSVPSQVREMLTPVVPHKNSTVPDNYNAMSLRFRGGYSMEFRVSDDGIAYRFVTAMKDEVTVENEEFGFSLPDGTMALWPLEKGFMSHNECTYLPASADTLGSGHLASLPALFMADGVNILLTEADIRDYPGMWITGNGKGGVTGLFPAFPGAVRAYNDRNVYVTEREDYIARTSGTRTYPWRVFIITRDDEIGRASCRERV